VRAPAGAGARRQRAQAAVALLGEVDLLAAARLPTGIGENTDHRLTAQFVQRVDLAFDILPGPTWIAGCAHWHDALRPGAIQAEPA